MNFGTPMLTLIASSEGSSFSPRYIPLPPSIRVTLGRELLVGDAQSPARIGSPTNGWLSPIRDQKPSAANVQIKDSDPLPLCPRHAEVWAENHKVYIRDLASKHGTYVNDSKITGATALKSGDIITLGVEQIRWKDTPRYITDDHLQSVKAKVTIVGV
ncbi:hypothetical protein JAAARDRAFT_32794 [Jaapia argillacea MUCL 33604]|uniref:FHA domain-containing protein n=1 Tax=Jaapia argillacea MUCL 33604 TaxID=933084 RepID=A0A067QCU0_9AGAM|nr:hypothetical protein JAAARDRAFT_32794 [Jaapia argillacea MUCL 33604]